MIKRALFVTSVHGFLIPVLNADPIVYPAKGQSAQQQTQAQADQVAARRAEYNKGYSACMEGRGYSVK